MKIGNSSQTAYTMRLNELQFQNYYENLHYGFDKSYSGKKKKEMETTLRHEITGGLIRTLFFHFFFRHIVTFFWHDHSSNAAQRYCTIFGSAD